MRDMVPRNNRSIRDIPVPTHPKKRPAETFRQPVHSIEEDYMEQPIVRRAPPRRSGGRRWFYISAALVVIICAVGGLLLSTLFAGATVTVFPREETVAAPKTLIAKLNPATGELGYQVMNVQQSASTTVPATGTHQVSRSAAGSVTVYNAFGTESQRLIANTRFAAPDGKIYRLHESIVVPGGIKNGETITPGAVTVTIYADSPGAAYNRGDTRFTIPGFQGDPRYEKFYAQGASMAGGFVGTEPAVAKADIDKASDLIKQGLTQSAQSALSSQVPPGYIAVPGSLEVSFSTLNQTAGQGSNATISQTATMSGAIVRLSDLAAGIAKEAVQNYGGESVEFVDPSAISIATATTTKTASTITLSLSGNPTLRWQYNPDTLKAALVGKSKSTFESIVQSFAPAISRAEAKVRPFWEGSFPSDPEKIKVEIGVK
jgi:hypothetical protein